MTVASIQWRLGSAALYTSRGRTVVTRWATGSARILHEFATVSEESYSLSCGIHGYDRWGHRPIAVDQPPGGGDDYPFVRPSEDVRTLLGDIYLYFKDDHCELSPPFYIKWLFGFGCRKAYVPVTIPLGHDYAMLIVDADDETVFDSRAYHNCQVQDWGSHLQIIEWLTQDEILRVVRHTKWDPDGPVPADFPVYIEPESAVLDGRAIEQLPIQLRSITLEEHQPIRGKAISFRGGYNTVLAAEENERVDGGRRSTTIDFDMTPGGGLGRYTTNCEDVEEVTIRRINGVAPDNHGNLIFTTQDNSCYRAERPVHQATGGDCRELDIRNAALELFGDCVPCCECEDFFAVYEALRRLTLTCKELWDRAHVVRDQLQEDIERIDEQLACREANKLRLEIQGSCPNSAAVAIGYCNMSDSCLEDVTLTADLSESIYNGPDEGGFDEPTLMHEWTRRGGDAGDRREYQHARPYELLGTYPNFEATFTAIEPGTIGYVVFWLNFRESSPEDQICVTARAYSPSVAGEFLIAGPKEKCIDLLQEPCGSYCLEVSETP